MATPILVGVGAIAAAVIGRQLLRSGAIGAGRAAEQWATGGFKAKMDRKEALAILGLKCVTSPNNVLMDTDVLSAAVGTMRQSVLS
jgi:hypothetical protein